MAVVGGAAGVGSVSSLPDDSLAFSFPCDSGALALVVFPEFPAAVGFFVVASGELAVSFDSFVFALFNFALLDPDFLFSEAASVFFFVFVF